MIVGLLGALSIMTAVSVQSDKPVGWERCQEDGAPVWLTPKPDIVRLLQIQSVVDLTSGAAIEPQGVQRPVIVGDVVEYLQGLGLTSIDVLMAGTGPYSSGFGPSEPGVYRVELVDRESPVCGPYLEYLSRIAPLAREAGFEADFAPAGKCVAYAFVGTTPVLEDYSHFIVDYVDEAAREQGYFRYVSELRDRSGAVAARAVTYAFENHPEPTCEANAAGLRLSQFLKGSI